MDSSKFHNDVIKGLLIVLRNINIANLENLQKKAEEGEKHFQHLQDSQEVLMELGRTFKTIQDMTPEEMRDYLPRTVMEIVGGPCRIKIIDHRYSFDSGYLPADDSKKHRLKLVFDGFNHTKIFTSASLLDDNQLLRLVSLSATVDEWVGKAFLPLTDDLTQVFNLRGWRDKLSSEKIRAKRQNHPLSCLVIDVDKFKDINDKQGHHIGDNVLKRLAKIMIDKTRHGVDTVARIGGDEFAILLVETSEERAIKKAESIRRAVTRELEGMATISIGAATYPDSATEERLTIEADLACYRAKEAGRNRVCGTASVGRNYRQ